MDKEAVKIKFQEECRYCHTPFKPFMRINGVEVTVYDWSIDDYYQRIFLNYCPNCGRYLMNDQ